MSWRKIKASSQNQIGVCRETGVWEAALHSTDLSIQIVNDKERYHAVQVRMEFAFFIPLWRVALLQQKSRTIEHYDALRLFA
jgi:hypothetical protein